MHHYFSPYFLLMSLKNSFRKILFYLSIISLPDFRLSVDCPLTPASGLTPPLFIGPYNDAASFISLLSPFGIELPTSTKPKRNLIFFLSNKRIYLLMVNHYKISFLHELMKKIELTFEYHFLIHYVFALDNDDEH